MTLPRCVLVTTTIDQPAAAARLAEQVLTARLAACVQTLPIRSRYWWKGKLETARETLLLFKTRTALAAALEAFIRDHHSYEVPEITVLPITGGHPPYLRWVGAETRGPARRPRAARA